MKTQTQMSLPMPEFASPEVELADWDVILLNTSGGKDSQTMISEVVHQVDAACIDRNRLAAGHADLGRVEWKGAKGEVGEPSIRNRNQAPAGV